MHLVDELSCAQGRVSLLFQAPASTPLRRPRCCDQRDADQKAKQSSQEEKGDEIEGIISQLSRLFSSSSLSPPPPNRTPGIPKFYRWLSERYPLVNQPVLGTHVPEVDALYLDMNGIIHNCTHGNDPGSKLTEEEMVLRIFQYLDKLFSIVQPQKLLFMAVDGEKKRRRDDF